MAEKEDGVTLYVECTECYRQMLLTVPLDTVHWQWDVVCPDCYKTQQEAENDN